MGLHCDRYKLKRFWGFCSMCRQHVSPGLSGISGGIVYSPQRQLCNVCRNASLQAEGGSLGAVSGVSPDMLALLSALFGGVPTRVSPCIPTQQMTSLLHLFMLWLMFPFWEREWGRGEETFTGKNGPWFEAGAASVLCRADVCFSCLNCEGYGGGWHINNNQILVFTQPHRLSVWSDADFLPPWLISQISWKN